MFIHIYIPRNMTTIVLSFVFFAIKSYGFNNHIDSITINSSDTISFNSEYNANIHLLDSYTSKKSIRLYWETDFGYDPPYVFFKEVRVYISQISPDSGFCELLRCDKIGNDSIIVEDLLEDVAYYFRVATYDSNGQVVSVSKPIMTITGEPENYIYSIPAPQRESPLYYSSIAWSADGNNIAFLKTSNNSVNIMNLDLSTMSASQATNYSGTEYRLLGLDWSPDNKWISYTYTQSSTVYQIDYRIWLVSPNGGLPHSMTTGRVDASATWLSSTNILFTKGSIESVNIPEFYTVDITDNYEKQLTSDQSILKFNPSFNHSNNLIAFYGSTDTSNNIYTMALSGTNIQPIMLYKYWSDIHPYWSPDGQNIIFTSSRSGHYEIWLFNVESNQIQQITRSQIRDIERFYGRPSPDGNQLAVLELGNNFNEATIKFLKNNTVNIVVYSKVLPHSNMLFQNYPNPFNPVTTIDFVLSTTSHIKLKVFDILGREIIVLIDEELAAGKYSKILNAENLPSGIYLYTLQTDNFIETKKLILQK